MAWNESTVGGSWFISEYDKPLLILWLLTFSHYAFLRVGFLEPAAFEEGILDRYPIFLSIVLNHISDDSVEFSHAVNCLRLLFEKLGI